MRSLCISLLWKNVIFTTALISRVPDWLWDSVICVRVLMSISVVTISPGNVCSKLVQPLGEDAVCSLVPTVENNAWDTWWRFTPRFFTQFLDVLGFIARKTLRQEQLPVTDPRP